MRALAFTLAIGLSLTPTVGRTDPTVEASAPSVEATTPPPTKYAKVLWKYQGTPTPVYVYSADQVLVIDRRIAYLEDKATKECIDAQVTAAKTTSIWLKVGAAMLTGVAIGYCAGSSNHCGIGK